MWDWVTLLLDRLNFYPVARPLTGAAVGLVVGATYGALCGSLHAALHATPALFVAWFLPAVAAGTGSGFIMGVCTALDRALCGPAAPGEPSPSPADDAAPRRRAGRLRRSAHLPTRAG